MTETPYFLLIVRDGVANSIDLDMKGWATTYADLMRGEATWHLVNKSGVVALSMVVLDGEQPYYVARHVGIAFMTGAQQNELTVYGIGKKRLDGHVDRLWVLPNGQICGGDDYAQFARALLVNMAGGTNGTHGRGEGDPEGAGSADRGDGQAG